MYYLSCPQIKLGVAAAVYKGKKKPVGSSSSYRRITVSPIIGAIIDNYIDPYAEAIFRPSQSPDQLGFTSGVSYLLAAIQGECQRWAVDQKRTCFGVSLDGEAAFPSVERNIQIRELYSVGERGDLLTYSWATYQNTECHIKLGNKLSRKIVEEKGNRQGHKRASGNFKAYINSCLTSLAQSNLGFCIGNLCITVVCVADDAYILADCPSGLQGSLDIICHFARRYHLKFNSKTKIVITGSKIDMEFYKDTASWNVNGELIQVVDDNDHLGLIVSGLNEEQKNVDANIIKCRSSLFALLGQAYSYKCLLSPLVQIRVWRTFNLPVLLSGLPALPIRSNALKSLAIFHKKILRGILKLSQSSPTIALYFLLGELPVEGRLHIHTLGLFHNLWCNKNTTVFSAVRYILKMCNSSSLTWSNHINNLCYQYGLPSPLALLDCDPCTKEYWSDLVKTRIISYQEAQLRLKASENSKMFYLNVHLLGLSGRSHPALHSIFCTQDAKKLRAHLKFLTCDLTYTDASCDICNIAVMTPCNLVEHALVSCKATADIPQRLLPELMNAILDVHPLCKILSYLPPPTILTQFLLDCSSMNLPNDIRVPILNPDIWKMFKICRVETGAMLFS